MTKWSTRHTLLVPQAAFYHRSCVAVSRRFACLMPDKPDGVCQGYRSHDRRSYFGHFFLPLPTKKRLACVATGRSSDSPPPCARVATRPAASCPKTEARVESRDGIKLYTGVQKKKKDRSELVGCSIHDILLARRRAARDATCMYIQTSVAECCWDTDHGIRDLK